MPKTANGYSELIAQYIDKNFGARGIKVYSEVHIGTSLIGSRRKIDLLVHEESTKKAFGIECKYQNTSGSVQEKIIYALEDLQHLRIAACLAYAGDGFSSEIRHHLMRSPWTAYCLPPPDLSRRRTRPPKNSRDPISTQQLDLSLAVYFDWWDIVIAEKKPHVFSGEQAASAYKTLQITSNASPEKEILDGNDEELKP